MCLPNNKLLDYTTLECQSSNVCLRVATNNVPALSELSYLVGVFHSWLACFILNTKDFISNTKSERTRFNK